MTVDEFFSRLNQADMAPMRTELLQRLTLTAEAQAKAVAPVRTGTFRRSITGRVLSSTQGAVGSSVRYAPFLEYGTRFMAPRPSLGPGIAAAKAQIPQIWGQVAGAWLSKLT